MVSYNMRNCNTTTMDRRDARTKTCLLFLGRCRLRLPAPSRHRVEHILTTQVDCETAAVSKFIMMHSIEKKHLLIPHVKCKRTSRHHGHNLLLRVHEINGDARMQIGSFKQPVHINAVWCGKHDACLGFLHQQYLLITASSSSKTNR